MVHKTFGTKYARTSKDSFPYNDDRKLLQYKEARVSRFKIHLQNMIIAITAIYVK